MRRAASPLRKRMGKRGMDESVPYSWTKRTTFRLFTREIKKRTHPPEGELLGSFFKRRSPSDFPNHSDVSQRRNIFRNINNIQLPPAINLKLLLLIWLRKMRSAAGALGSLRIFANHPPRACRKSTMTPPNELYSEHHQQHPGSHPSSAGVSLRALHLCVKRPVGRDRKTSGAADGI